jgi:OOP family OmpA-OmpF porin
MITSLTTRRILLGIAAVAGLSAMGAAFAHDVSNAGYLIDSRGNVVKTDYGQCVRTGYWTPAMATEECDPELVKKPEPKVETPPPPVAGPEKPAVKATFKAEALFDFDKSVVRPDGKKALDEQAVQPMKEHPEVELLLVIGHTDRIGTKEYNQRLSERRAAAVKAYLVSQGIAAERIKAYGVGKSEPDPDADTAKKCHKMSAKKIIECLQPDRRVVVTPEIQKPTQK